MTNVSHLHHFHHLRHFHHSHHSARFHRGIFKARNCFTCLSYQYIIANFAQCERYNRFEQMKKASAERERRITEALKEIKRERLSIRQAAEKYEIPRSTLANRVRGAKPRHLVGSHTHRLLVCEEAAIVEYALERDFLGYPPSIAGLTRMANVFLMERGCPLVNTDWARRFVNRYAELKCRISKSFDHQRASKRKVQREQSGQAKQPLSQTNFVPLRPPPLPQGTSTPLRQVSPPPPTSSAPPSGIPSSSSILNHTPRSHEEVKRMCRSVHNTCMSLPLSETDTLTTQDVHCLGHSRRYLKRLE